MAVTLASATQVGLGINQDLGAVITFAADATASTTSRQVIAGDCLGLMVVIDITAITAGSLTVTIEGVDRASGKVFTVLASAALAGVATTVLKVYPGGVVTANLSANDHVPPVFDIKAAIVTGPVTATISAHLLQ